MKINSNLILAISALLVFGAASAIAGDRGRFNGNAHGRNHFAGRGFRDAGPRYVAPSRGFGGFRAGQFYQGRGYYYSGNFWARPYFGAGVGIPFGYGYRTPRGCGYVDGFGRFFPAPCY